MKTKLLIIILFTQTLFGQLTRLQEVTLFQRPNTTSSSTNFNCVTWNGKVYYIGYSTYTNPIATINLMSYDGTLTGISTIKNLVSTPSFSYYNLKQWKPAGNYIYFVLELYNTTPSYNVKHQLWRTDGTATNTILVDEVTSNSPQNYSLIDIGSEYSFFNGVYTPSHIGNDFYYSKFETNRYYMWKTDGNPANNVKISTTYFGSPFSIKKSIDYIVFENNLYFVHNSTTLIKYDGTNFTEIAKLRQIGKLGMIFNNKLYFYATNPTPIVDPGQPVPTSAFPYNKMGIYVTDGTVAGTTEYNTETYTYVDVFSTWVLQFLFKKTNNFFLVPDYQGSRTQLYTINALGLKNGVFSSTISKYFDAITNNEVCYFTTQSNSDLTKFGTSKINKKGLWEGSISYAPGKYLDFLSGMYGNTLYFSRAPSQIVTDPNYGDLEFWRTNGFSNESGFGIEINPAIDSGIYPRGGNPFFFFKLNNDDLYFIADYNYKQYFYKFKGDFTFNNSVGNSLWVNPNNWNAGMVPISTENVTVPSGFNISVDGIAAAGDASINSPINLTTGNLSIGGNLMLNSKITLNNNNLVLLRSNSSITGNSNNYIVTNGTGNISVENLNTARGTVNLPIGTATNYNPISIANSGTSDTFSARVAEGNTSTNPTINATWEISEAVSGGSNVNLTFGWNQSQENSGFDRNSAKIGHFTGGNWVQETTGTLSGSNPYSLSATGITSFSPFSVMNFSALGTTDFSKSKLQVYPNPFVDNLNISTQENGLMYFFDGSGKLVSTSLLMKGNNSLNQTTLQNGVYIYQIKNTNGEIVSSGKVIKK